MRTDRPWLLMLGLVMGAVSGCAGPSLLSPDASERALAMQRFNSMDSKAKEHVADTLLREVENPHSIGSRSLAIGTLGNMGRSARTAVPVLSRLFGSWGPTSDVLGAFQQLGSEAAEAVPVLNKFLENAENVKYYPDLATSVALTLEKIGTLEAQEAVKRYRVKVEATRKVADEAEALRLKRAEAERRWKAERAEKVGEELVRAAAICLATRTAARILRDELKYRTLSSDIEAKTFELGAYIDNTYKPSAQKFLELANEFSGTHGYPALRDLAIKHGFLELLEGRFAP